MTCEQKAILIIEDDIEVREAWRDVLTEEGYMIRESGTTDDAINAIKHNKFDLVLLDLSVPPAGREGGFVFLESKSKTRSNRETPVIIITGIYLGEEKKKLSQKYNVVEIINKPVPNEALVRIIHMVLNNL